MLTIEEIRSKLKDRVLKKVAASAGLSYPTVWNIAREKSGAVTYKTIKKLSDYLEQQ